jgi:hypothetical protein
VTRAGAISTAQHAAIRFDKPFVVYRFVGWTAGEYGVIAVDRGLPPQAEICDRLEPVEPLPPLVVGQGALF